MGINNVTWCKASYSGANGGGCVEIGLWRKSSYSGANGGECIEVGVWRKATFSGGNGGECAEVTTAPDSLVAIRDSKDPDGPNLSFTPSAWRSFLRRNRI